MPKQSSTTATASNASKISRNDPAADTKTGVFDKAKSIWSAASEFVATTKQKVKNELASRRGESHPDPKLPKRKVHENYDVADEEDLCSLDGGLQ